MAQRYQAPGAVLSSISQKLASARNSRPEEILDAIVKSLAEGRGYAFAGIYLAVENLGVRQATSGSSQIARAKHERASSAQLAANVALDAVNGEIVAPIRLGARTLGLIVVETGRTWVAPEAASAQGAARQERVLLQQVAKLVARYLTTDRAKQLLRKTREQLRQAAATAQLHKSPQSARPALRRAAAGQRGAR